MFFDLLYSENIIDSHTYSRALNFQTSITRFCHSIINFVESPGKVKSKSRGEVLDFTEYYTLRENLEARAVELEARAVELEARARC